MTDPSIPLSLQLDILSSPVVTRLAKLPDKVLAGWPVTVQSRAGQALVLLDDGIAIVCDNLTYRAVELQASSRVTFTDDTHASVRLPLSSVEVEFANVAEAQQFRTEAIARAATAPAGVQDAGVPPPADSTPGTRVEARSGRPEIPLDRTRAQTMRVAGLFVLAVGVVLAKIGTTSMALFVFYIMLVAAGAGLAAFGDSQYRKTLG
jgi:hypothetical protein